MVVETMHAGRDDACWWKGCDAGGKGAMLVARVGDAGGNGGHGAGKGERC
jgi:hypothetical protein